MRVLIVGCGYVGYNLGAELNRQGHSVWGLRRTADTEPGFKAAGILPIKADITVPESFPPLGPGYDWVIHCVSASGRNAVDYERVYFEGTRNLISWLAARPPSKFVYTSSTSVYGQTDGGWVDEASPTMPIAPTARLLVRTEHLLMEALRQNKFPVVVLRVAGIYGPNRAYWLEQIKNGDARIEALEDRILNMIHRDDVAGAIIAALERAKPGGIFNVVDDQPVAQRALVEWLSSRLRCSLPPSLVDPAEPSGKRGLTNKRVSNLRLKKELAYQFKFPTFREGYEAILAG